MQNGVMRESRDVVFQAENFIVGNAKALKEGPKVTQLSPASPPQQQHKTTMMSPPKRVISMRRRGTLLILLHHMQQLRKVRVLIKE
jgi:hypothetical protein